MPDGTGVSSERMTDTCWCLSVSLAWLRCSKGLLSAPVDLPWLTAMLRTRTHCAKRSEEDLSCITSAATCVIRTVRLLLELDITRDNVRRVVNANMYLTHDLRTCLVNDAEAKRPAKTFIKAWHPSIVPRLNSLLLFSSIPSWNRLFPKFMCALTHKPECAARLVVPTTQD